MGVVSTYGTFNVRCIKWRFVWANPLTRTSTSLSNLCWEDVCRVGIQRKWRWSWRSHRPVTWFRRSWTIQRYLRRAENVEGRYSWKARVKGIYEYNWINKEGAPFRWGRWRATVCVTKDASKIEVFLDRSSALQHFMEDWWSLHVHTHTHTRTEVMEAGMEDCGVNGRKITIRETTEWLTTEWIRRYLTSSCSSSSLSFYTQKRWVSLHLTLLTHEETDRLSTHSNISNQWEFYEKQTKTSLSWTRLSWLETHVWLRHFVSPMKKRALPVRWRKVPLMWLLSRSRWTSAGHCASTPGRQYRRCDYWRGRGESALDTGYTPARLTCWRICWSILTYTRSTLRLLIPALSRCSLPPRRVDPSVWVFSLSSHRHSYIVEIPIDSDLSITIDKLRVFINKTLSTESLIN